MADATGREAGIKFLEANKSKDGVIVLASGFQYKVLRQGWGLDHPKVATPCECNYAGTLIDGTEFDSSYKRGKPTTFAPNQVIKGWTEAMQLMVEGDKWEMYIPMELAYGPEGKPPKIPAAAALIFTMEICSIKGPTTAKQGHVFPEWTEAELKLWTEKDQAAIQKWKDARVKSYEDGNMRDLHPTRDGFESWVDKQGLSSRNKTLWKRTRKPPPTPPTLVPETPKLTKETARALLDSALAEFKKTDNKEKLEGLIKECDAAGGGEASQANMMKMMKLMPAVQEIMGPSLTAHGFAATDLMMVTMQIQALAADDPSIASDVAKIMKAVQGDVSSLLE